MTKKKESGSLQFGLPHGAQHASIDNSYDASQALAAVSFPARMVCSI